MIADLRHVARVVVLDVEILLEGRKRRDDFSPVNIAEAGT